MKKLISFLIFLALLFSHAFAAEVWVLCQPDSYVNIRPFANKKQIPCGYMECGWKAETNGETKNGYLYLDSVGTESNTGWVKKGYIVYSEPVIITVETNIYSKGRVACWRSIGGKRRCWAKDGDSITVHAVSEEWSVTNKGFVKTKYLGVDYDALLNKRLDAGQTYGESDALYWEDE